MIIKIANSWADWLVTNGADSDDHDVYVYGAEFILNELISDFVLILTSLILHKVFEVIVWMLVFTPLRINLGGMHASSHFKCICLSTILCYICIYTAPLAINYPIIIAVISAISLMTVFKIAPVVHQNHPVSETRMLKSRRMAKLIVCLEVFISAITYIYFSKKLGCLVSVTTFSACILGIFGKLNFLKNQ